MAEEMSGSSRSTNIEHFTRQDKAMSKDLDRMLELIKLEQDVLDKRIELTDKEQETLQKELHQCCCRCFKCSQARKFI